MGKNMNLSNITMSMGNSLHIKQCTIITGKINSEMRLKESGHIYVCHDQAITDWHALYAVIWN